MRKKIVTIGGGTGSFTVLSGLKNYPVELTAIISMMDSGGSTGILRDEFGILPPGDVRRALIALSPSSIMRKLFEYRFEEGNSFSGHSFGNLFLTALTQIFGGEENAIQKANEILNVKGTVIPVTTNNTQLCAELTDGSFALSESEIGPKPVKKIFLSKPAKANKKALVQLKEADAIIIGPGDLYTSIIPNFLVKGIPKAIKKSKATKIFICNIMTKGETKNFTALDYVNEIENYLGLIPDLVIMNNKKPSKKIIVRYLKENSKFVKPNYPGIKLPMLKEKDYARHDSNKLAKAIYSILEENKNLKPKNSNNN